MMRRSKTIAKLRAGEPARVCSLGHFIPAFVCHAAQAKYDCVWLDLEHRSMSDREVQSLLAHFHLFDIDCLLRASTCERARLYRYLEDGASGIMIPHVSSASQARELVAALKFPPLGNRGIDGAGMDADFMLTPIEAYVDHANNETFLVVQIESPQAVERVDDIAAVDGVDALFVGTGDLGLRIDRGKGAVALDSLEEAVSRVAKAAERHGKAWGCPASSTSKLRKLHEQGARLIAYGGEFTAFMDMFRRCSAELDEVYGP